MKIRTLLSGIAVTVALAGCSTQTAALNSGQPSQTLINYNNNADSPDSPAATLLSSGQNQKGSVNEPVHMQREVTLFELNDKEFAKKTNEIPNYYNGEISYVTQAQMNSFNEGHSVALGSPLERTITGISNLIPYDYMADPAIDQQLGKAQGGTQPDQTISITSATGVVFTKKPFNKKSGSTTVEVQVPRWGNYTVTLKNGQGSDIQLIQKIEFAQADDFDADLAQKPLQLYELSEAALNKGVTKIPYYENGNISYTTKSEIQSVNEGHSPWKATPLLTAQSMTTNLIPEGTGTDTNGVEYRLVRVENANKATETTIVEIKILGLGIFRTTLKYAGNSTISFITKIDFQPQK